jgi:hypothetical protein
MIHLPTHQPLCAVVATNFIPPRSLADCLKFCGRTSAMVILLALGAVRAAAAPSDSFTISGQVSNSPAFAYSSSPLPLLGLPEFTETDLAVAGAYTGVSLESLLTSSAVGIKPDPTQAKNSIIAEYVVAMGSDGYRVVYSGGELDPNFGGSNTLRPDLLAYQLNGAAIGANGAFRTIVPGDTNKGGRYVSNVTNISVGIAATKTGAGGTASQFLLSGLFSNSGAIFTSLADLTNGNLPVLTENVTYLSAGSAVNNSFSGVSLWSFLSNAGLQTDPYQTKNHLNEYVLATGSDGYKAVFSLGELDPSFGGQPTNSLAQDLIAYTGANSDGAFRIVVPGDLKGGRYIANVVSLEVIASAAPPGPLTVAANLANGKFYLAGLGGSNTVYQVQASTNLAAANWLTIGAVHTDTNGVAQFSDASPTNTQRYYRLSQ